MNTIDRLINYVNPIQGFRRQAARAGIEMLAATTERTAGQRSGSLGNWLPRRLTKFMEARQRETIATRAEHLIANDPYAAATVDSLTINTVGQGLRPQSRIKAKRLGLSQEAASELQAEMEWAYQVWSRRADAAGRTNAGGLQFKALRSMFGLGEFVALPLMINDDPNRRLSLALQVIDPLRLRTPEDLTSSKDLRDGVRLGDRGQPVAYFIAAPEDGRLTAARTSKDFTEYPAWLGHRPGVLHAFHDKDPEQVRGVSALAPAMKSLKDLGDYLDFELIGAIIAASFPVFIEKQGQMDGMPPFAGRPGGPGVAEATAYQEVQPGQILYGNAGEKPHLLSANRPVDTFAPFVDTILTAAVSATGQPKEVVSKNFRETNYSSARAALLEAWRVYMLYRAWLVAHFCQPVWEMVIEEAWLRGLFKLPKGAPDFYQAREEYCHAVWLGPPRGHIDPLKEVAAQAKGLSVPGLLTLAEIASDDGADWEERLEQWRREQDLIGPQTTGENNAASD